MNLRDLTENDAGYAKVEDGRGEYRYLTTAETIQLSQAISLKRIADALSGEGCNLFTAPINCYGESIGDAIQGQLVRGQAGISQY